MPKLNFELAFATLIPEFINQFLGSPHVDKESITCLDLEDLRDAIKNSEEKGLDGIKRFLSAEAEQARTVMSDEELTKEDKLEMLAEELDSELEMVDDDMYHKYTAGELKYVFGEIMDNIEDVYDLYKNYAELNITLNVGFMLKNGLESGLVIEFLSLSETPEYLEDVFFIPVKNYLVSDGLLARVYLVYEKEKESQYKAKFDEIAAALSMKGSAGGGHEHGPGCDHLH